MLHRDGLRCVDILLRLAHIDVSTEDPSKLPPPVYVGRVRKACVPLVGLGSASACFFQLSYPPKPPRTTKVRLPVGTRSFTKVGAEPRLDMDAVARVKGPIAVC